MTYTLALEGGATHARAGLYDEKGDLLREIEGGPANPIAYGVSTCARSVAKTLHVLLDGISPADVWGYAAFAGAADTRIQRELATGVGIMTGLRGMTVTSDLHALIYANASPGTGILAISGTGASVIARNRKGQLLQTGGWGMLLGDEGSGYAIAVAALRACARAEDGVALQTVLTEHLTQAAGLQSIRDFVGWSAQATKRDIAALTPVVAAAAEAGDIVAISCIEEEAHHLAALALAAQEKFYLGDETRLFEYGSVLESCGLFRNAFRTAVNQYGELQHSPCNYKGHRAVYELASLQEPSPWMQTWQKEDVGTDATLPVTEETTVPVFLDALAPLALVQLMNLADMEVPMAVGDVLGVVAQAVEAAAECLLAGGRMIYVGAGTSGRLGALDAAECPPTFGVSPDRVIALLAGGDRALRESVEGAEDDRSQGIADLEAVNVSATDIVIGIAASGNTPYVGGALETAQTVQATTVLVTSNPNADVSVDMVIAPETGPESLPGSTRLKAGTAAKMILNMISTGAMAKAGYVYQGRMVNMTPVNAKLRLRAQRIVAEIVGISNEEAAELLKECNYHIPRAIVMAKCNLPATEAAACLEKHQGRLRETLSNKNQKDQS